MKHFDRVGRFQFEIDMKTENNGFVSCHVPAYDIYYSAKNTDDAKRKGLAIVKTWLDFYKIK